MSPAQKLMRITATLSSNKGVGFGRGLLPLRELHGTKRVGDHHYV